LRHGIGIFGGPNLSDMVWEGSIKEQPFSDRLSEAQTTLKFRLLQRNLDAAQANRPLLKVEQIQGILRAFNARRLAEELRAQFLAFRRDLMAGIARLGVVKSRQEYEYVRNQINGSINIFEQRYQEILTSMKAATLHMSDIWVRQASPIDILYLPNFKNSIASRVKEILPSYPLRAAVQKGTVAQQQIVSTQPSPTVVATTASKVAAVLGAIREAVSPTPKQKVVSRAQGSIPIDVQKKITAEIQTILGSLKIPIEGVQAENSLSVTTEIQRIQSASETVSIDNLRGLAALLVALKAAITNGEIAQIRAFLRAISRIQSAASAEPILGGTKAKVLQIEKQTILSKVESLNKLLRQLVSQQSRVIKKNEQLSRRVESK
jgi:hypothetical protein